MSDLRLPNLNMVLLSGRLVADPELRYTPKGTAVCSFRVACSRFYRDRDSGEFKKESDFFNVVVWDRMAELAGERLRKGSAVLIEGSLRSRSYEAQDGGRRYVVEILSKRLQFLESAPGTGQGSGADEGMGQAAPDYEDPFES